MKIKVPAILLCLLLLTSCSSQSGNQQTNTTEPGSSITEQNTVMYPEETSIDNSTVAEMLGLTICDETDNEKKTLCDSYFEEYLKARDTECEYINIGRCDSMNADDTSPHIKKHLTGGYVYCVDRSWEENWYYYVNPDQKAIYSCMVGSDMYLCWKDGISADEAAASDFAKSILGDNIFDTNDNFYVDLDGYYSLYYISDNSYIRISWDMTQIFYEKLAPDASYEDYHQQMHLIYPEDTIGYFS